MLLVAFAICTLATDEAVAERLLLKAKMAYTMVGKPLKPAAVLIEDGKILQVAQTIESAEGVKVLDLSSSVLMPGMVNAYTQIGVSGGSSEFTQEVTPGFDILSAIDWQSRAFREALDEGVTCVGVAPGTENVIAGGLAAVKTAGDQRVVREDAGLLLTLASDPRSRNRARTRPDTIYVRQPTNRMGVMWILRHTLSRVQKDPQAGDSAIADALAGKRQLFCVSRTQYDIESLLTLTSEFQITATIVGGQEAYKLAPLLAKQDVPIILGPLRTYLTSDAEGTKPAWNRAGLLNEAGVLFALSGSQLLEQARFAVRFGLPRRVALRAITATPAKLLGIGDRLGTISPGRAADLVVFSGDPLEFTSQIQSVIVDGVIYERGKKK